MTDVRMKGFAKRSSVREVDALIESRVVALGTERVPFILSLGRTLAQDVVSDRNVPPHPKSAMDGYAVRAADLPGTLQIAGQLMAADTLNRTLQAGQTVRIMTGARIPEGADTVVMFEDTTAKDDRVEIAKTFPRGTHVLATGEDLATGQTMIRRGRTLRPQDLAMLVNVGALEVDVVKKPRVRIVPTGTELVRVGVNAPAEKVVESNSFMLEALARRDGAEPIVHPIIRDEVSRLEAALSEPGADIIVMTGGSSVGKEDLGPVVVRQIGELPIHGIHIKPASPTGVGFVGKAAVVLAPGFPVASYIAWDMFVRPIIQRMLGQTPTLPYRTVEATLGADFQKPEPRTEVQRVKLIEGEIQILRGGAALLSTLTEADGFVLLEEGRASFPKGTQLNVYLYD